MSLELDLADTASLTEPMRERGESCAAERVAATAADRLADGFVDRVADRFAETAGHAGPRSVTLPAPAFRAHPLTRHYPRNLAPPRVGELHLWRFRCEWLPVPVQEGDAWLSKTERERARLHPNAALRKRFISARVVVRWIVGHLFECEPGSVDLHDDGSDKLRARHPRDGSGISIEIAFGGIWIMIGVASTTLGLSVVAPAPGATLDETPEKMRGLARYNSLCNALRYAPADIEQHLLVSDTASSAFDLAGHGMWHLLDLPMGGKVRAAVALAQPVTQVHTFGWPKGVVFIE